METEIPLTLDTDIQSFSCGFDIDFSGSETLKAYKGSYESANNTLNLAPVTKVPAYNGVALVGKAGNVYTARMCETQTDDFNGNNLYAAVDATSLTHGDNALQQQDGRFHTIDADAYTSAWSAYLPFGTSSPVTLNISGTSDISGIGKTAESETGEYYNLQGVKVDARNLQKNIYILRKGGKTLKVVIK